MPCCHVHWRRWTVVYMVRLTKQKHHLDSLGLLCTPQRTSQDIRSLGLDCAIRTHANMFLVIIVFLRKKSKPRIKSQTYTHICTYTKIQIFFSMHIYVCFPQTGSYCIYYFIMGLFFSLSDMSERSANLKNRIFLICLIAYSTQWLETIIFNASSSWPLET